MDSHRHARGEELGVLRCCQHPDLPCPHDGDMSWFRHRHEPAGWIQSAGEESSDPTHAGHAETAGQVWACTGLSVLWGMCDVFWLPSPGTKQLSSALCQHLTGRCNSRKLLLTPAAHSSTETFLKLRLKPACLLSVPASMHPYAPCACPVTGMENQS